MAFIDGLRGAAALYVVLHHAYFQVAWNGEGLIPVVRRCTQWLSHGTFAVDLFIVLSGFCLMLPVTGGGGRAQERGVGRFLYRRARRILPPYYAAMAICMGVVALVPALRKPAWSMWAHSLPIFTPGVLLSHLFLVHNLSIAWIWKIDSPAWSIATEWQIYWIFALILLPVWRRFGIVVSVALAFALGNSIEAMMPASNEACFYYIGFFGMGMAAAVLYRQPGRLRWVPWNLLAVTTAGIVVLAMFVYPEWTHRPKIEVDYAVGITAAMVVICLSRFSITSPNAIVLRLLGSGPATGLGRFSYSLYLIHYPLLAWSALVLKPLKLAVDMRLLVMMGVIVPLTVGVAWVFFYLFERPFIGSRVQAGGEWRSLDSKKTSATNVHRPARAAAA